MSLLIYVFIYVHIWQRFIHEMVRIGKNKSHHTPCVTLCCSAQHLLIPGYQGHHRASKCLSYSPEALKPFQKILWRYPKTYVLFCGLCWVTEQKKSRIDKDVFLTSCFSDRASWIDYTLITNLMHWLLFIRKILLSSTCFEHQVLIFRRT